MSRSPSTPQPLPTGAHAPHAAQKTAATSKDIVTVVLDRATATTLVTALAVAIGDINKKKGGGGKGGKGGGKGGPAPKGKS